MEDKKELFDEQLDAVTGGVPPHVAQASGVNNNKFARGQFAKFANTKGVNMQFGRSNFANQNMNSVRSNFENTNTQFSNTNINFNNTNNSNEN